jgi:hypothetical protein
MAWVCQSDGGQGWRGGWIALTEPIKFCVGVFVQTALWKFAANPSVLGYVRMAVAKEKAPARQNASRGHLE